MAIQNSSKGDPLGWLGVKSAIFDTGGYNLLATFATGAVSKPKSDAVSSCLPQLDQVRLNNFTIKKLRFLFSIEENHTN